MTASIDALKEMRGLKSYKTTYRKYNAYHKKKYGLPPPCIEALGEDYAYIPLLTLAQAIEFIDAMAFAPHPWGQNTYMSVCRGSGSNCSRP